MIRIGGCWRSSTPGQKGCIPVASGVTDYLYTSVTFSLRQKITSTNAPKGPTNGVLHYIRPGRPSYSRQVWLRQGPSVSPHNCLKKQQTISADFRYFNDFSGCFNEFHKSRSDFFNDCLMKNKHEILIYL